MRTCEVYVYQPRKVYRTARRVVRTARDIEVARKHIAQLRKLLSADKGQL